MPNTNGHRSSALFFTCKSRKNKKPLMIVSGVCQQYVSSRLSEILVPCIGVLQAFAGQVA